MDDAPLPTFIVDECLPAPVFRPFLESRGFTVLTVGEAFPRGSPDRAVLAVAEVERAIVISSDAHWRTLLDQVHGHKGTAQRAGRILMNCDHAEAFGRFQQLFEDIEREIAAAYRAGRRVMIRILLGSIRIDK